MPRTVLYAAVLIISGPLLSAQGLQAQTAEEDGIEFVTPAPQEKAAKEGWWNRQVQAYQQRRSGSPQREKIAPGSQISPVAQRQRPQLSPVMHSNVPPGVQPIAVHDEVPVDVHVAPSHAHLTSDAGFVRLDAPLYPCPQPFTPPEMGSTVITNSAFAPHEMLYPHEYRSLYGPFYHKTTRKWVMTPFGVYKYEHRQLTGTQVRVKYKSRISPFTLFAPNVSP